MKHAWLVALAVMAAGCTTPSRDPHAEGARLMAELRQASGGAALDRPNGFHETGTVVMGEQSSTYDTWGDLRALRWVGVRTIGGQTFTKGFDGERAWRVGPNGVQVDTSPRGLADARLETYLTIGGFLYPDRFPADFVYKGRQTAGGVSYDVVTVTPRDATPIDLWLDVRTHLLRRASGMDGDTPFEGVILRYQVVDGVQVGYELHQSEGGREMAQALTSYAFVDVPPQRFSPPVN